MCINRRFDGGKFIQIAPRKEEPMNLDYSHGVFT